MNNSAHIIMSENLLIKNQFDKILISGEISGYAIVWTYSLLRLSFKKLISQLLLERTIEWESMKIHGSTLGLYNICKE